MIRLGQGFRIGDCEVVPDEGTILSPRGLQRVGPRPMALLTALAARPGKVFSRTDLMDAVWSGVVVSDETLSRCISDLRQALGDDPRTPRYIQTLSRRGYRLLEKPRPLKPDVDEPAQDQASATAHAVATRSRLQPLHWLAIPLVLALAVGLWLTLAPGAEQAAEAPEPVVLAENGIAVLPFANLSDDEELEYFSDGLTEELLNRLAAIEALAVVARTSSFAFKGTNQDVREIGQQLGVAHVLEGSVRRQEGHVRIAAQLIDVHTGFHLFSRVYERPFADIFAIQEHIALEVGAALEPRFAGIVAAIQQGEQETSPEALEAYLLGRHLQRKLTVDSLQRAIPEYRKAIELDPEFARAHGGLASTLVLAALYADQPLADSRSEIESSIERALVLDPRSAAAWHARGLLAYSDGNVDAAIEAFASAHRFDPNDAGALGMHGRTLYLKGHNREAVELTRKGLHKDPLNQGLIHNHAAILAQLGEFAEAERWLRRSMEIEREAPDLNTLWTMAGLKYLAGEHLEAVKWYEKVIERGNPHSLVRTQLGWVLLELGDFEGSRQWIEDGLAKAADPLFQLDSLMAWHYFQGDHAAVASAVHEYDERFPNHAVMPVFRGFAALLNGNAATAVREYESLAGRNSERLNDYWDMFFGHWHALNLARARQLAGQHEAAEATLAEAERFLAIYERQSGMPAMVAFYRAAIASLRGDQEMALEFLDVARQAGWRRYAQIVHGPLFDGLRGDARLAALHARVRQDLAGERLAGTP